MNSFKFAQVWREFCMNKKRKKKEREKDFEKTPYSNEFYNMYEMKREKGKEKS